jgi:hypothetical protein
MQENSQGSRPDDFLEMIAAGGLTHIQTFWYPAGWTTASYFYFMLVKKALPGLAADRAPTVAVIPLQDPAAAPVELPRDRPCILRLRNEAGRPLRPELRHESGEPAWWLPFGKLDPGQEKKLPLLALRAGAFELRDQEGDTTVARLEVM